MNNVVSWVSEQSALNKCYYGTTKAKGSILFQYKQIPKNHGIVSNERVAIFFLEVGDVKLGRNICEPCHCWLHSWLQFTTQVRRIGWGLWAQWRGSHFTDARKVHLSTRLLTNNPKASEDINRKGLLALRRSLKLSNKATLRGLLARHWYGAYVGMHDCPTCQKQQVHGVKSGNWHRNPGSWASVPYTKS